MLGKTENRPTYCDICFLHHIRLQITHTWPDHVVCHITFYLNTTRIWRGGVGKQGYGEHKQQRMEIAVVRAIPSTVYTEYALFADTKQKPIIYSRPCGRTRDMIDCIMPLKRQRTVFKIPLTRTYNRRRHGSDQD